MIAQSTRGINCATLTPMDAGGAARVDLLAAHCRWLLEQGCAGIVLLGTTGEANSFTVAERQAILEGVLEGGIAPERLIVGAGCCAAGDSIALTKHALAHGVRRVLLLPPFYYKSVEDRGIIDAFARTIEAIGDAALRVYLYQIPQLTGVSLGPAIIDGLIARYPGAIAGIKDSSGDWTGISQLCSHFGGEIDVLVGSERYLVAALKAGASGCVTATANARPALICDLYEKRDDPDAGALQEGVAAARAAFEGYPMIAALKEFTARRTGESAWRNLRPPLTMLSPAQSQALQEIAR